MSKPKGKHLAPPRMRRAAPVRKRRDGSKLGIRIACLLMMLIIPMFITIYNGAVAGTANAINPPLIEGSPAAHNPGQTAPGQTAMPPEQTAPGQIVIPAEPTTSPEQPQGRPPAQSPDPADANREGHATDADQSSDDPTNDDNANPGASDPNVGDNDADDLEPGNTDAINTGAGNPGAGNPGAGNPGPVKAAYLTFDDGPTRSITPGILEVLSENEIKATFFVLPQKNVDDLYMRIIDEGHEIGNHSYSHVYSKLYKSGGLEDFRDDVLDAQEFMLTNFGYLTTAFRFPGGSMGRSLDIISPRQELLDELGYRYFNWHIDSGDARADIPDRSAAALTRNVLENTRGRDHIIILMHDSAGKASTLAALPKIIEGLREQGYSFDILKNYPQE